MIDQETLEIVKQIPLTEKVALSFYLLGLLLAFCVMLHIHKKDIVKAVNKALGVKDPFVQGRSHGK